MIEVSEKTFFSAIGGPENIGPSAFRDHSSWINLSTGEAVGRSEPGYARAHGTPERYFLSERFAEKKGISGEMCAPAKPVQSPLKQADLFSTEGAAQC